MLDIKEIRESPEAVEAKIRTKEPDIKLSHIVSLDGRIREIKHEAEELKGKRNALSKTIGEKKRAGEDVSSVMEEVGGLWRTD